MGELHRSAFVSKHWLTCSQGTRWLQTWSSEVDVASKLAYFTLTTVIGMYLHLTALRR
jgi:hypothetical protein